MVSRAKRPMAVTGPSTGQARFDMILWTYCRRAPREPAGELQAIVFVPMHPDDPDLPGMLSPTHWILGLGGREFDYADVTLQIEDRQVNAQIKHRRIAGYGRPRPESEVRADAQTIMQAMDKATTSLKTQIRGAGLEVDATFEWDPKYREITRAMLRECSG